MLPFGLDFRETIPRKLQKVFFDDYCLPDKFETSHGGSTSSRTFNDRIRASFTNSMAWRLYVDAI